MKILLTGAAGFIGFHTAKRMLDQDGTEVVGIDNLNSYYSVALKLARLNMLAGHPRFKFVKLDFADAEPLEAIFHEFAPDYVVHLGAQAGVRYSLQNPNAYIHSNIAGFLNILEACRRHPPKHLLFASSSSVYGAGSQLPFTEDQTADEPESLYAATKRANELMAHSYSRLYGLNITAVRIFTAYGPWGRPDMTPMLFACAIREGKPVELFNHGNNYRDFTYVDDVVNGIARLLHHFRVATGSRPPYRVFNLGHNQPVKMSDFVHLLAKLLGRTAHIELLAPQAGDIVATCADLRRIQDAIDYTPQVSIGDGLKQFVDWFLMHEHQSDGGLDELSVKRQLAA